MFDRHAAVEQQRHLVHAVARHGLPTRRWRVSARYRCTGRGRHHNYLQHRVGGNIGVVQKQRGRLNEQLAEGTAAGLQDTAVWVAGALADRGAVARPGERDGLVGAGEVFSEAALADAVGAEPAISPEPAPESARAAGGAVECVAGGLVGLATGAREGGERAAGRDVLDDLEDELARQREAQRRWARGGHGAEWRLQCSRWGLRFSFVFAPPLSFVFAPPLSYLLLTHVYIILTILTLAIAVFAILLSSHTPSSHISLESSLQSLRHRNPRNRCRYLFAAGKQLVSSQKPLTP